MVIYLLILLYNCICIESLLTMNAVTSGVILGVTSSTKLISNTILPKLCVFDFDECLWAPETYTLTNVPNENDRVYGQLLDKGNGVIGVKSGGQQLCLYPDALKVLQEIYLDEKYSNMRIAAASSANTPLAVEIAMKSMTYLEILPGVTMRDAFNRGWDKDFNGNIQIGRSPPLNRNKSLSHFPIIKKETGIEYTEMVYYDDCTWDNHVDMVERNCKGVIATRTPIGMTLDLFYDGLNKFHVSKSRS